MNLQTFANLGILGGGIMFLLGGWFMIGSIYTLLTYRGSGHAEWEIFTFLFGVAFMAIGATGLGGSFLARKLPLIGGLIQLAVGAFAIYTFVETKEIDLLSIVLIVGSGLLIIGGVFNIISSFTAQ